MSTENEPGSTQVNVTGIDVELLRVLGNATGWHANGTGWNNSSSNETETFVPPQPQDIYRDWETLLYSRVTVAICIFGMVGNLLNLMVLSMKQLSGYGEIQQLGKSANIGLLALSFSDLVVCVSLIPLVHIDVTEQFFPTAFEAYYTAHGGAFTNIFVLSSTWLIVSMATSRYIVICHPLKSKKFISTKSTKTVTLCVVVVCFLLTLPQFWEHKVTKFDRPEYGPVVYVKHDGYLKQHPTSNLVYVCAHFIIGILVPFIVLIFCNVSLVRSLRMPHDPILPRSQTFRDRSSTRSSGTRMLTLTLVIIVVMYIVFEIPAELIRFLQDVAASGEQSGPYNLGVAVVNTLQIVNFAFNFILYCAISSQFRKCMLDIAYCNYLLPEQRRRMNTLKRQVSYQQSVGSASAFRRNRTYRLETLRSSVDMETTGGQLSTRSEGDDEEERVPLRFTNGGNRNIPL